MCLKGKIYICSFPLFEFLYIPLLSPHKVGKSFYAGNCKIWRWGCKRESWVPVKASPDCLFLCLFYYGGKCHHYLKIQEEGGKLEGFFFFKPNLKTRKYVKNWVRIGNFRYGYSDVQSLPLNPQRWVGTRFGAVCEPCDPEWATQHIIGQGIFSETNTCGQWFVM